MPRHAMSFCGPDRYFDCTSRPLCNAKRNTARNGAVVELIAAAATVAEDKDKRDADGDVDASGALDDQPDPTGITRHVPTHSV